MEVLFAVSEAQAAHSGAEVRWPEVIFENNRLNWNSSLTQSLNVTKWLFMIEKCKLRSDAPPVQKNDHKLKTETWKNKACRKSRKNSVGVNVTKEKSWNWKILSIGKSMKKYRKNISTSYLAKKSSIRKQGNKTEHTSGRNGERGVWWLMATCHLISSECSYHIGRKYKNAPIYWDPVLGKHVTIL